MTEDKILHFKSLLEQVKQTSLTIISWSPTDRLDTSMKKLVSDQKGEEKKKSGWGRYLLYALIAYIVYSNVMAYLAANPDIMA